MYCNGRPNDPASDITPIHWLGEEKGAKLGLLCLSNGPTLAFKDMAMQLLGNLFEYALKRANQDLNILGATSGDTGSAAEYAMRGKHGIKVFAMCCSVTAVLWDLKFIEERRMWHQQLQMQLLIG